MQREYFRIGVGLSIICVHALCFMIFMFGKDDWLSATQRIDSALLLLPVTASYAVAVIRGAIENQAQPPSSKTVNLNYALVVSSFTVFALIGLLLTVIQIDGDLDFARRQILLFEIVFGAGFGLIAADLFGKVEPVPPPNLP